MSGCMRLWTSGSTAESSRDSSTGYYGASFFLTEMRFDENVTLTPQRNPKIRSFRDEDSKLKTLL